jgi:DNA repair exonuclease SbcCD ATPase subunit
VENREIPASGVADDALLRHNRASVRSDDVSRELAALQEEIAALLAAEQEDDSAMAALEAQLTERRDRLTLARRLLADHQKQIEQKRAELEEAVAEDARERFEEVMREREATAASLAEAAELLLERLAAFDRSQDAARAASATAQAAGAAGRPSDLQTPPEITAEPEVMREPWDRLCHEIRNRINEQFEAELVDAASRSPLGSAINDLPLHLRDLARQRRHAIIRDAGAENGSD